MRHEPWPGDPRRETTRIYASQDFFGATDSDIIAVEIEERIRSRLLRGTERRTGNPEAADRR